MIKALLSDFDDTLVFTIGPKWKQHIVAAQRYGIELTEGKIRQHWGEPLPKLIANLYELKDEQAIQLAVEYYNSLEGFPKAIKPGAIELVRNLAEKGIVIGIITATIKSNLISDLSSLGFDLELLSYLQAADETDFHKPNPKVFDPALKYLDDQHGITNPEEMVYIGDSLRDYYAARDRGLKFVGIPNGVTESKEDLQKEGAFIVEDLVSLERYLLEDCEVNKEYRVC